MNPPPDPGPPRPTVWAISDLHLSFARDLRPEHHAARWRDHADRIAEAWTRSIAPRDLVLIPGDISLARNHREVQPDLAWLARLPGRKILSPGNHDQWFNHVGKVRAMLRPGTFAVSGDALEIEGLVIAGARSTIVADQSPDAPALPTPDRDLEPLRQSLAIAAVLRDAGQPLLVLWHHPPFDRYGRPGPAVPLLEAAGATACVYGHLHTVDQWSRAVQGTVGGVRYACVAADAVGFRPLRIIAGPDRP
jgi:predicted phosphohydrolase